MTARGGLLLVVAIALAGCAGSLLESRAEAPETYRLQGAAFADRGTCLPLALAVARPHASPALDSERIAVVRPDRRFDYYAGMRWAEPAPEMLQQRLVHALAADGCFAAVVAAPSRVPAELLLDVELRRFEATYAAAGSVPEIRVELQLSLVEPREARRVTSVVAAGSAVATADRRGAVIEAFERASSEALLKSVDAVRQAAPAAR